jgi:glycerol-3-phosphate dehydrogenase (NAD(P)+)
MTPLNVTILGAGAWGTALALLLDQNRHRVRLWGHNPEHLAEISRERTNDRALPGVVLPPNLEFEPDLDQAILPAQVVVIAVPSGAVRAIGSRIARFDGPLVSVTKGIEAETGLTMCGILKQVVPGAIPAALSGPSLALEVARGIPTAVVAAAEQKSTGLLVQDLFHRPAFRVYTTNDLIGVELGGALKNVMAIAAGVCDGLAFGDNSKAALITRGQAEMRRIGIACGARPETFAGLSGLGDLTVTCFSRLSRNRSFGELIGRGQSVRSLLAQSRSAIEGHPTARSALALANRLGVPAPITREVYAMLYEDKDPRRAVHDLLSRDSKAED